MRKDSFCLLSVYVLATSNVIAGRIPTCNNMDSWWLYSAASLGHQANGTMTCYPIQSHYPDTVPISPNNAEHQAMKQNVSILKSNPQSPDSNPWGSDSLIFQYGSKRKANGALSCTGVERNGIARPVRHLRISLSETTEGWWILSCQCPV